MSVQYKCVCVSKPISIQHQLCKKGDGKHAGRSNYRGSKKFSWMISFATAEERVKEGGRRMSCERGAEGADERMNFSWNERQREVEGERQQRRIKG